MPNPHIQAESILIGQIPALGQGKPLEKHFEVANIAPQANGKLILPAFKCHTFVTVFGSDPDRPSLDNPLDLKRLIHISVRLSQCKEDPLSIELLRGQLDLRNYPSHAKYHSATNICPIPFVRAYFNSGPWAEFDVPNYGPYLLKTRLKIEGTDEEFFIQNVCPIDIAPPKS